MLQITDSPKMNTNIKENNNENKEIEKDQKNIYDLKELFKKKISKEIDTESTESIKSTESTSTCSTCRTNSTYEHLH